jgi:DNA-damage-inducible protein J
MVEAKLKKAGPGALRGVTGNGKARVPRKDKGMNGVAKAQASKGIAKRTRARTPGEMKSSMLHIRLENALKDDVTKTLDKIGISMPEAIRVFLKRIVREQAFPFRLEVPNAETEAALRESLATTDRKRYTSKEGMFDDRENNGVR